MILILMSFGLLAALSLTAIDMSDEEVLRTMKSQSDQLRRQAHELRYATREELQKAVKSIGERTAGLRDETKRARIDFNRDAKEYHNDLSETGAHARREVEGFHKQARTWSQEVRSSLTERSRGLRQQISEWSQALAQRLDLS